MHFRLFTTGLIAGWIALAAPAAEAFCGFYVGKADSKLFNDASQVVLVRDGERTVITMSNDYKGELTDFALFKDDAGQLPGVLSPREETVVDIVVTHQVTKLPPEFHPKTGEQLPPKEERRTEVEFVEADKMFGCRRVRVAVLKCCASSG